MKKFIQEFVTPFINKLPSEFTKAYRKANSTNHVLLRLIEQWKSALSDQTFVLAVLMNLSKAFDCIPYDLFMALVKTA